MRLAFRRRLILSQRGHEDFPPVGAFEGCDTFRGCCRRCVYIIEQQDRASLPVIRGPKSPAHGPATQAEFFRHYTCAYVDWVFVPFNLVVVRTIDWRRVGSLLLIVFVSILVSIITHADWQYHGTDGGHMIARAHKSSCRQGVLDQIDGALKRIEEGSYGRCEECGEQIPKTRLDAVPYAAECERCASQREKGQARG